MNSTSSKTANARLRFERESRGWSQEDVAEKVGTTQKIVSRWERGASTPLPYYRQKLCKLFGKNAAELGFLDEQSSEDHPLEEGSKNNTFVKGSVDLSLFDLGVADKLDSADSVTPRWHALLEISRAQAYCDAGDMSTGIDLACKGFIMAYQCRSHHLMNRVRKLLRKLEKGPFRTHPSVQDLKNLLYETYIRMD